MKNSHSGGKNSHSAEKIHIQKTQILDPECGITHAECGKKTLLPTQLWVRYLQFRDGRIHGPQ